VRQTFESHQAFDNIVESGMDSLTITSFQVSFAVATVIGVAALTAWCAQRTDGDLQPLPEPDGLRAIRENQRRITIRGRVRRVSVLRCDNRATQDVVVLFVPGAGGQADQFFGQAPLFAPEGSLCHSAVAVLYSHASHGPNARETYAGWESLSFSALSEDLVAMHSFALEQARDPARASVVIVAHSLGAALTATVLHRLPRLAGVILLAPPLRSGSSERTATSVARAVRWALLRAPPAVLDVFRTMDRRGAGATSASVSRMVGRRGVGVDPELALLQKVWNAETPSRVVQAISRQAVAHIPDAIQYGALLRAVREDVKVVVVAGEHDQLTPPESVRRVWAGAGSAARYVLLRGDVGHQVMAEQPQRVNELIVDIVAARSNLW
jgi:pimeloyl-ACP methyl ester carboxylesterase